MMTRELTRRLREQRPNTNNHDELLELLNKTRSMRRQGTVRDSPSIKITSIVTVEIIEYVSQQSVGSMPLNMQVVLSQLLLADVSHRSFYDKTGTFLPCDAAA